MTTLYDTNTYKRFSAVMTTCSIISALMVVWIHAYNIDTYDIPGQVYFWFEEVVSEGIARAAVPFFFISSAFFLFSKNRKVFDVYQSRTLSIVVPYLLWNIVYMVAFAVLRRLSLTDVGMDAFTVGNLAQGLFLHRWNYTYWFMRDLIVLIACYPLIRWILRRGKVISFMGLAMIVVAYECGAEFLKSAFYYYIGAVIGFHYSGYAVESVVWERKRLVGVTLICVCVGALLFWLKNVMGIEGLKLYRDLALAFSLFFVVACSSVRIGGFFAGLSFMIYSLHPLLLEFIEKVIYLCFPHSGLWMMVDYIVAPIICVALICGVCFVWKKLLPGVYKCFNGGHL